MNMVCRFGVNMDSGQTITVVQAADRDFKVGDEVKITDSYLAGTWQEAGDGLPKPNSYRKDWLSLDDPRRLW